jgi:hypothetical protein
LTLQGSLTGVSKTYDGTTSMPVGTAGHDPLVGVIPGDTVLVSGAPVFASANVVRSTPADLTSAATTQAIQQGTVALAGAQAGNYTLVGDGTTTGWINGLGTINPAVLTVRANDDAKFVTMVDPNFSVSYAGFVNGETISVLGGDIPAVNRSNVGSNQAAGTYANTLLVTGGSANNYSIQRVAGNFEIVGANQLLVRANNITSTYGQNATYSLSGGDAKYIFNTDATVDITTTSGAITSATVNAAGTGFQAGDRINVTGPSGANGAVLEVLTVSSGGVATLGVVNGGTGFANATALATSKLASVTPTQSGNRVTIIDSTGISASFDLAPQNTGTLSGASKVRVGAYSLGANNLALSRNITTSISGVSSNILTLGSVNGMAVGDSVSQAVNSATGTIVSIDSGAGTVTLSSVTGTFQSGSVSVEGARQLSDTANFQNLVVVGSQTVTQAALTPVANTDAKSKTYDGNTVMLGLSLSASAAGVLTNDAVSLGSDGGAFASKTVSRNGNGDLAVNKTYTVSGLNLSGGDAGNYYLTSNTVSGNDGQITPRTLGVTYAGVNKVYNASNDATVTTADDRIAGDILGISRTAVFADVGGVANTGKNVGSGKTVSVSGISLSGTDAGNYTVSATGTATANITAAPLHISGFTASDKVFNGNDAATLTAPASITTAMGLKGSDALEFLSAPTGTFASANAGVGQVVTINSSGVTFSVATAADASNYTITYQPSTTATISPRPVTVSAAGGVSKNYDGTTSMSNVSLGMSIDGQGGAAANTGVIAAHHTSGVVNSGDLSVSGVGAFGSSNVSRDGSGNVLSNVGYTLSNLRLTGAQAGNYVISGGSTSVSGSNGRIDPVALTITASNQSMDFGSVLQLGTSAFTATGLLGTDAVTGVTLQVDGNATVPATKAPGSYAIVPTAALGSGLGNYTLSYANGTLGVSQSILVVAPVNRTRVYGTANPVFTQEVTGFLTGDSFSNAVTGTLGLGSSTTNNLTGVGSYVITANTGGLTSTKYSFSGINGTLTITPRNLDLTIAGVSRVYDGSTTSAVAVSYANPVADDMRVQVNAVLDNKNVGTGKAVTINSVSLTGTSAANYVVNTSTSATTGTVTQLPSATWVGGASGDWFNPVNWVATGQSQTGAIPDRANVAAVVLPTGSTVNFDTGRATGSALTDPVTVASLQGGGGLQMTSGLLTLTGNGALRGYQQTGGSLRVNGDLTVNTQAGVSQTAGQLRVDGNLSWRADTVQNQDANLVGSNTWNGVTSFTGMNSGSWRNLNLVTVSNLNLGDVTATGKLDAKSDQNLFLSGNIQVASLSLEAVSGSITQSGGVLTVTAGPTDLMAGDDITLDSAGNDFTGTVNATGNDITLVDSVGGLTLGNVDASGTLNVSSTDGDITQANGTTITVDGTTTLNASDVVNGVVTPANITLDGAANDFGGTVNATGGNIALVDGVGGLILGNIDASGTLNVSSTDGAITQDSSGGNKIVVDGTTTLSASDVVNGVVTPANITLDGAANDFGGTVNATGGNIALVDGVGGLILGNIDASGTLNVSSTDGAITQDSSGGNKIVVDGTTTLSASDVVNGVVTPANIRLDGAANDFGGAVNVLGANDVTLNDTNSLTLGNVTTTGNLDATAGNDITLTGTVSVANLTLEATDGALLQNGGALTVSGLANLSASADIQLASAGNDFMGLVNAQAQNVSITDSNALSLGTVTAQGNLTLASTGTLDLGTTQVAGVLNANSGGGNITQSGSLRVDGVVNLTAGDGEVILTSPDNRLLMGTTVLASRYAIEGDAVKEAMLLSTKSSGGSAAAVPAPGTALSNANTPVPLVVTSAVVAFGGGSTPAAPSIAPIVAPSAAPSPAPSAASESSSSASAPSATATVGAGTSAGVMVDVTSSARSTSFLIAAVTLPRGMATAGTGFSFELPASVREIAQQAPAVQASLPNGSALPTWLKLDAAALRFDASAVPNGAFPMQVLMVLGSQSVLVVISERTE